MKKFKKILASTDMSSASFSAVSAAAGLARTYGAELIIVHVVDNPLMAYQKYFPKSELWAADQELRIAVEKQLEKWAEKNIQGLERHTLKVVTGDPVETICDVASEVDASVIVLATHARQGAKRVFLGSTAESIVRNAPCPVMTIRPGKAVWGDQKQVEPTVLVV